MTAIATIAETQIALKSLRELGLEGWEPSHSLPDRLNLAAVHTALAQADAALRPSDRRHIAVASDKIVSFGRAFNIPIADVKGLTEIYLEDLSHLPPDLLALAVQRIRKTWKWGNRLPLPADLLAQVEPELAERRRAAFTLRTIAWKAKREARRPKKPPDPEMAAKAEEFLARRKQRRQQPDAPLEIDPELQRQWKQIADEVGL